jgi:hypothetical protein
VTTNMRNAVEQAAYEAGRAAAKYEMLIASSPSAVTTVTGFAPRPTAKASSAPKTPKARIEAAISRGAKKAATTRTKGVKEAVVNLIASEALAVPDIVSRLGFKEGSVRAVLMGLKKDGRAIQDGKLWAMAPGSHESGNSGTDEHVTV